MLTGASLEFMTINQTLERAVELSDYWGFRKQQTEQRTAGHYPGIGICTYLEPGPGPTDYSQALGFTYEQRSFQRARVKVEIDGTVSVYTSQQPHGQSHETTLASGAITGAARIVRSQMIDAVAHLLEADPADLDITNGKVFVKGSPDRFRTVADVARISFLAPMTLPASIGLGLDATFDFETPPGGWTQSTHVCWVDVDIDTGMVQVTKYLVVEDCGRMINPAVVDGQIRGGVAQGIGAVLFEQFVYDDQGQPLSSTLMDYLAPTAADLPPIEIEHLEGPVQGDIPFRGVGEGGAIGAPAALTNAIEDALAPFGVKITEQHLPPARILELIETVGWRGGQPDR